MSSLTLFETPILSGECWHNLTHGLILSHLTTLLDVVADWWLWKKLVLSWTLLLPSKNARIYLFNHRRGFICLKYKYENDKEGESGQEVWLDRSSCHLSNGEYLETNW